MSEQDRADLALALSGIMVTLLGILHGDHEQTKQHLAQLCEQVSALLARWERECEDQSQREERGGAGGG